MSMTPFKNKERNRLWIILFVLMAGLIVQSCRQKELIYPDPEDFDGCINVRFEWDDAPDANPEGMTLYFFPVDSRSRIWRFDIAGRNGGTVELPYGNYTLLAYNNDLPDIYFTDIQHFEAFTANARTRNDSLAYAPGMLYCGIVNQIHIRNDGCEYSNQDGAVVGSKDYVVKCSPISLCSCYTIEIRGVTVNEHLRSATATLYGLAPSVRLYDDNSYGNPIGIITELETADSSNTLKGVFHAFGTAPGINDFRLTATIQNDEGKYYSKNFDVTSQILNCSDKKNVLIIVEGIKFPDDVKPPSSSDVGMEVDVDGWKEINIDLSSENNYPSLAI